MLMDVKTEAGLSTVKTAALLFTPCADAVICAAPATRPEANPALLTDATLGLLLDHANEIPLIAAPCWS